MTDSPPQASSDPGRWIRAALVLFPAGTVLLGIASFGIWQWKKDREADRSFKYALALKRDISLGGLEKHTNLLREVLKQADALQAVPGYLQSTLGEENMGYSVRRDRFEAAGAECSNIDSELAGKQMPYDVTMVLVPYGAGEESAALALATMLSMAHELTGQPVLRTLRFATVPRVPGALEKMAERLRADGDRLKYLHVLGAMPERLEEVWGLKALGTAIEVPVLPASAMEAVTFTKALRDKVLAQTGQP
jgi:hypothetical protein